MTVGWGQGRKERLCIFVHKTVYPLSSDLDKLGEVRE